MQQIPVLLSRPGKHRPAPHITRQPQPHLPTRIMLPHPRSIPRPIHTPNLPTNQGVISTEARPGPIGRAQWRDLRLSTANNTHSPL